MKISLDSLRSNPDFYVHECQHQILGLLFLVVPAARKQRWNNDELHLRSLLCTPNGEIVCAGLPKFFDIAEPQEDATSLLPSLQNQMHNSEIKTYLPEKVDGTLLIRTVIDGQVCFRTRGSHQLGRLSSSVLSLIESKYPNLLDPSIDIENVGLPEGKASLLMEFVDPSKPIIVQYSEAMIKGIGIMKLSSHQLPAFYSSPQFVAQMHEQFALQ